MREGNRGTHRALLHFQESRAIEKFQPYGLAETILARLGRRMSAKTPATRRSYRPRQLHGDVSGQALAAGSPAAGSFGHCDRLVYDPMDVRSGLATLPLSERGTDSLLHEGVAGHGAAAFDHLEQPLKKGKTDMLYKILALPLLFLPGALVMAEDSLVPLFDFAEATATKEWQTVNDGVMGGVSEGKFRITEAKTLEFTGTLSLENNGGFASVRAKAKKLSLEKGDTVVAKVRGDGREYTMNLYVKRLRIAFAYQAAVPTKKDEWVEVRIPLDQFEATSFGNKVKDAGPVNPDEVNAVGFLLGDKKAGPFQLEIESIRVERVGTLD